MKVILMMVMTADGFIAKSSKQNSTDWSSEADKKIFIEQTKKAGAIIMGLSTYKTIGRPLPGRLNLIMTHHPKKEKTIPGQLEYTKLQPTEILKYLRKQGFDQVILGGGTSINSLFLQENLIDEIRLTVEPLIFGGGLTLFKNLDLNKKLELLEINKLDKNVINLRYKVIK
ncbi:MAG TPA: dihydrofolate reductase family protein [Patescibacteria group bacterium]|nr:dihydrofolate reductase family protein [Patescibacteria group bacterium]